MKNKEQGSSAITAMVAVGALGLVSFFVNNSLTKTNGMIQATRESREQEEGRLASTSALSKFKAMMAERRDTKTGKYMPGIYATDYFAGKWNLKNYENLDYAQKKTQASGTTASVNALAVRTIGTAEEVMSGRPQIEAGNMPLTIALDPIQHRGSNAALVETVKVTVTGQFKAADGSIKKINNRAEVKVPVPMPRDPVLEITPAGQNKWSTNFNQMSAGGKFQFRAKASGIVFKARLYHNGALAHTWGGYDVKTGKITHKAVSYDSDKVVLGAAVDYDLGKAQTGAGELNGVCKFVPAPAATAGSHEFELELEGVNGDKSIRVKTPKVTVTAAAAGLGRDPTLNEIRTMCSGSSQCPFIEDDWDADKLTKRWDAGAHGDMSSGWTYNESNSIHDDGQGGKKEGYNVGFRKMCINFDKGPNAIHNFKNADLVLYDLPSCTRKFFSKRSACGCVTGDSMVLMGDGVTEKRISEIQDGDHAWNPVTKKPYAIRKVTRGPENKKPMLAINAGGRMIRATGNHPFVTKDGRNVRAMDLGAGDVLKGADGKLLTVESVKAEHPGKDAPVVWNLELEAAHTDLDAHNVQINGIVTGDLMIQTMLESGVAAN